MLKPVAMSKIRAVCPKAAAPLVIRALQSLSVLHIKDAELPSIERSGPLPSFDEISPRAIRIRSMREQLGKSGTLPRRKVAIADPVASADELLSHSETLASLIKERDGIAKELEANLSSQRALADFSGLHVNFSALSADSLQFLLIKSNPEKSKAASAHFSGRKNCAFLPAQGTGSSVMLLVAIPKSEDPKQYERFGSLLPLPSISGTAGQEISSLSRREEAIREKLLAAEKRLARFSSLHYPRLVAAEEALSVEADRARIASMFGASPLLYYIEGWAESSRVAWLRGELERRFGKKVLLSVSAPDLHREVPPTRLSNPRQASAFQFLVEFLSTTNYSEIDPTLIIAFTIPLLYALIFGDALYAVLSFLMAFFMVKKSKPGSLLNQVATIWAISAVPAFFAGIAFDEFFGFSHEHLLSLFGMQGVRLYEGMHRVSSINALMLITIIAGTLHLALGFLLGAINEWGHSKKHAIAKLCWLGVEMSGFFLVASFMFGAFPALSLPALVLFALSLLGMLATEGPIAAVEIPSLASNIMSYIRIAAVGVGGVILAEAINELLLPRLELTPAGIIVFMLTLAIYLAVHALSCALAMFESFIHGARLNVVEFFGKFYKGNGVRFSPFSARRLYTQEAA